LRRNQEYVGIFRSIPKNSKVFGRYSGIRRHKQKHAGKRMKILPLARPPFRKACLRPKIWEVGMGSEELRNDQKCPEVFRKGQEQSGSNQKYGELFRGMQKY